MTRHYQPDGQLLVAALAGRVDALEELARRTADDVTALGRGVADLTGQIRRITAPGAPGAPEDQLAPAGTANDPNAADAGLEPEPAAGQPDWLTVTDPDEAAELLTGLTGWLEDVGAHHGLTVLLSAAPCWPLHPNVVADLLALCVERGDAYAGERPTPVSEWHTRWLPGCRHRVDTALAGCVSERGHTAGGRLWDATGLDPQSIAAWWATDRATPAHTAFDLPALT